MKFHLLPYYIYRNTKEKPKIPHEERIFIIDIKFFRSSTIFHRNCLKIFQQIPLYLVQSKTNKWRHQTLDLFRLTRKTSFRACWVDIATVSNLFIIIYSFQNQLIHTDWSIYADQRPLSEPVRKKSLNHQMIKLKLEQF